MKQQKIFMVMAFALMLIMVSQSVLAINGFRATSVVYDTTNITRSYLRISYVEENYITYFWGLPFVHEIDNYVPLGQPYEAYLTYGLEPLDDWNAKYPNSQIDYCTILVKEYRIVNTANGGVDWNVVTALNRTFTTADTTATKDKYNQFFIFKKGEFARVYFDCHVIGNLTIETPVSMTLTAPTFECKACQYLNTYKKNLDDTIGDTLNGYSEILKDYMKQIISLNIEIWNILFWIFKITLLLFVIGLIFLGIYWFYLFIKEQIRRV